MKNLLVIALPVIIVVSPLIFFVSTLSFWGVLLGTLVSAIVFYIYVQYRFRKPLDAAIHRLNRRQWLSLSSFHGDPRVVNLMTAANSAIFRLSRESLAFRELFQRFRHLLDELDVGVIHCDSEDAVRYMNRAAAELLGVARWEWVGKPVHTLLDKIGCQFSGRNETTEVRTKDPTRDILLRVRRLGTEVFITLTDVTKLRDLEKRLEATQRVTALAEVVSSIAHGLKTPIANAKLAAQVLQKKIGNEPHLNTLVIELRKLDRSLTSVLNAYKLDTTPRCVKVVPILKRCVQELNTFAKTKGVDLTFEEDCEKDVSVRIAPLLFEETLKNLLKNAVEASWHGGKVRLVCRSRRNSLRIMLCDNGQGMTEEQLRNWRQPFYTTKSDGMGLGTILLDRLLASGKVDLRVRSTVGKGTVMVLECGRCEET
ncbi:MAG: hypothetical protein DRP27_07055 [Thermotogae bacterium]|nr:MAG: hypothetical protein DRP27_07055 [Thermotogota bacterium]